MARSITAPAFAALLAAAPASAQQSRGDLSVMPYDGSYDDAVFAVENALIGRGLVIDHVSHVGAMLARTKEAVGGTRDLFENAQVFLFCSAVVSREVMEADPLNIAHCPYGVFVLEDATGVSIGHRTYPEGPMQAVETLLSGIVAEAMDGF